MDSKILIALPISLHFTDTETGSERGSDLSSHKARKGWSWDLNLGLVTPNAGLLLLKSELLPKK